MSDFRDAINEIAWGTKTLYESLPSEDWQESLAYGEAGQFGRVSASVQCLSVAHRVWESTRAGNLSAMIQQQQLAQALHGYRGTAAPPTFGG